MAELEKMEHPKPQRDFIYGTFNAFADRHPWVGEENIRPKSIAREMFEGFRSFSDYVQEYDLERAEGLLLRHLNSVYKVLGQTVPDGVKTDTLREMELYLRDMLRQVDASLLEEWERMRDPNYRPLGTPGEVLRPARPEGPPDVTRDPKAFTAAIRTRAFAFLRAWSIGKDQDADVHVAGMFVAGRHVEITRENGRTMLRRVGGLRPVRVGGRTVKEIELKDNDEIQIASESFVFHE